MHDEGSVNSQVLTSPRMLRNSKEGTQLNLYGKKAKVKIKKTKDIFPKENNITQLDLFGKKAKEDMTPEGNVVLGFTSNRLLMLDCDDQQEGFVIRFAKKYAKFHRLGSVLVLKTSESCKTDLFGNRLGNYAIIFGKPITWKEIRWHVKETLRLGVINRGFAKLREFGTITIRVNSKNKKIPPPKVIKFYPFRESSHTRKGRIHNKKRMIGIVRYIQHRNICEGLGESWITKTGR